MPQRPFPDQVCSIAGALGVLGERWTLLVMREVLLGRRRFGEIRTGTGVAPNILTDRLGTLVGEGLLRRRRYGDHPDAYEYVPTRKGVEVQPVLLALMAWGDRWAAGEQGPPRVAVHTACGHPASPALHCSACGEPLPPDETLIVAGPGASTA